MNMHKKFLFVLFFSLLASCSLQQDYSSTSTPSDSTMVVTLVDSRSSPTRPAASNDADIVVPFPLDMGGRSGTPATYKGSSLLLQENGEPQVTPVDGLIGVVCIGMSNANQECTDFIRKWEQGAFDEEINPQVRFVNCAVGGRAIEHWNNPDFDIKLWDACLQKKIPAAGLTPEQIRVIWHKAASIDTLDDNRQVLPPYPNPESDYFNLYDSLSTFAIRVHEKLPAVQAVYVTSRSYGGYASKASRGEPLSFEEGMALNRWLAENQMVAGVWYGWGPYIWAPDCSTGVANNSGVCYERSDYQADGIHPAQGARDKVSLMLHQRFRQHTWYQPWQGK